ncbi:MAG: sigma-54 dependent transcriptional regulator [Acidobacteriota bacterium]
MSSTGDEMPPHGSLIGTPSRDAEDSAPRGRQALCEPHYAEYLGLKAVIASSAMRRLMATAEKIARTNAAVLITGESGTGKEVVARAIHHFSPRAGKPFIDVNCAALPENLMESELFGYEKGAFSGADAVKPGLFETAHGGTLFLDEIGELDPRMQAKLLRVLDGQSYFRLGGTRKILAEARVVAATNLVLARAIETGKFRRDLFHRLDAFQLRVPALRDRVEDIAPLCRLFLRDTEITVGEEALGILEDYSWPGNIRELRNVLIRAALFVSGNKIGPDDLPLDLLIGDAGPGDGEYSLNDLEQQTIFRVLGQTNGHQQKAANLLGISRRTLIRKLKLYRAHVKPEVGKAGRSA